MNDITILIIVSIATIISFAAGVWAERFSHRKEQSNGYLAT